MNHNCKAIQYFLEFLEEVILFPLFNSFTETAEDPSSPKTWNCLSW